MPNLSWYLHTFPQLNNVEFATEVGWVRKAVKLRELMRIEGFI